MIDQLKFSSSFQFLVKLLIVICVVVIMYFGAALLIPLAFAGLIALLLLPVVRWCRKKGYAEYLSISAALLLVLILFGAIAALMYWQSSRLGEQLPLMKVKIGETLARAQSYIEDEYHISKEKQDLGLGTVVSNVNQRLGDYLGTLTVIISDSFLAFVYVIILLKERSRIKTFMLKLIDKDHARTAHKILEDIVLTVRDYLSGQLMVTAILFAVYTVGFYLIGINFSIILALVAAILTFIPYLGNILGGILVVAVAMISPVGYEGLVFTFVLLIVVQLIESYIFKPWIIGSEISLNIFAVIVSIVIFSLIWGIAGSIMALPLTSSLRILFSKTPGLQPYAYLLSDKNESEFEEIKNT